MKKNEVDNSIIYQSSFITPLKYKDDENFDIIIKDKIDHRKYTIQRKFICDEYPDINYWIPETWKDCILKCLIETKFSAKHPILFKYIEKYLGKYKEKNFKFTPKVIYPKIKNAEYVVRHLINNSNDLNDYNHIKSQEVPYYGLFMYYDNNIIHLKKVFLRHEYDYYYEKCKSDKMLFIGNISKYIYDMVKKNDY